jgi:hypothetical protein
VPADGTLTGRGRRLNCHVRRLWSLAEPQPNAAPFSRRFGGSLRVAALLLAALLLTGGQHQACQRRAGPPPSFPVFVHGSRDSSGKVTALTASGGEGHEDGYRRGGRKGEEHPHARDHGKPYPDQQRKRRREDEQGTVACLRPAGDDEGLLRRHPGIGECIFRRVHQNQGHRCVPAADVESVEMTAFRTLSPSTIIPFALSMSMIMMSVSVTSRRACSLESSGSGMTTRVPLRPMVYEPRLSGTTVPAPTPLWTARARRASSADARRRNLRAPGREAPSTRTAPLISGAVPTLRERRSLAAG